MLSGIPLFPVQASTVAPDVDRLYFLIIAVTSFFAIATVIAVAIFAIKYRDDSGEKVGAQIHGSIPLELAWSVIPFIISMGIFVYATVVFFEIVRPPAETLEIYSTGKRWMWRFQHVDGKSEINELHVPKGRPVRVTFTSEDVLHSLYFPAFRVKADAIPGRYSSVWFEATQTGDFHLFCAEYCGTKHSGMIGKVVVMEPSAYQAWLSGSDGQPLAVRGQQLFQQLACVTCHLDDNTGRGPSLAGLFGTNVELRRRRRKPSPTIRLHPRVDPDAADEARGRLSAADADVPGSGERRGRDGPDRVHQVQGRHGTAAAGRRRRPPPRRHARNERYAPMIDPDTSAP